MRLEGHKELRHRRRERIDTAKHHAAVLLFARSYAGSAIIQRAPGSPDGRHEREQQRCQLDV